MSVVLVDVCVFEVECVIDEICCLGFYWMLFVLCGLCFVIDGFDV